jgi:hypothetical protein
MLRSQNHCFTVILILSLFLFSSGRSKRPEGFPKLSLCSITVIKKGQPVPKVCVLLRNTAGQGSWGASGTTDSTGTAVLSTSLGEYNEKGIPAGEYIISLDEIIHPPNGKTIEEIGKLPEDELYKYIVEEAKMIDKLRTIPKLFWILINLRLK